MMLQTTYTTYTQLTLLKESLLYFIYEAKSSKNGQPVLIWHYKAEYLSASQIKSLTHTANRLLKIEHPNILKLIDSLSHENSFYAIYEYIPYQTIEAYLKEEPAITEDLLQAWGLEILHALQTLESQYIACGSINLNDILITPNKKIMLSNISFGLEILLPQFNQFELIDEGMFLAPEILFKHSYSRESDMYSFGIFLYLLLNKQWPYRYTIQTKKLQKTILQKPLTLKKFVRGLTTNQIQLLNRCLSLSEKNRFHNYKELIAFYTHTLSKLPPLSLELEYATKKSYKRIAQKNRWRLLTGKTLKYIIASLLVIGSIIGYQIFENYVRAIPEVQVPLTEKKSLAEAEQILKKAQLRYDVAGTRFDRRIPKNHIIESKPPAGRIVKTNRRIKLFLSSGPAHYNVPDLVGRSINTAKNFFPDQPELITVTEAVYSLHYPEGFIIKQTPTPNEPITNTSNVSIIVSKGYPVIVSIAPATGLFAAAKPQNRKVSINFQSAYNPEPQLVTIVLLNNDAKKDLFHERLRFENEKQLSYELPYGSRIEIYFDGEMGYQIPIIDPEPKTESSDTESGNTASGNEITKPNGP